MYFEHKIKVQLTEYLFRRIFINNIRQPCFSPILINSRFPPNYPWTARCPTEACLAESKVNKLIIKSDFLLGFYIANGKEPDSDDSVDCPLLSFCVGLATVVNKSRNCTFSTGIYRRFRAEVRVDKSKNIFVYVLCDQI